MDKNGYQITVPGSYTGGVFLFCWTYLMFYANTAGIEAAAPVSLMSAGYTFSAVCMCVTVLVISFVNINRDAFLTSQPIKAVTGIAMTAGSALLVCGGFVHSSLPTVLGGCITGVFSGIMCLQWVLAYQRVGLRVAANSFPMLMAMAVSICVTLMYLPPIAMIVATITFPLISELMFHAVRKNRWPVFEEEEADQRNRPINFVLLLLPIAVYSFSSGFLDFSSSDNNYTFAFYAFGAFIPVIAAGVFAFAVDRPSFIGIFVVPVSVLVAVSVPFLTTPNLAPLAPFISIGELGIEVLLFILSVGFAQFFTLDALKTYALAKTIQAIVNAMGWYFADILDKMLSQHLNAQASLMIIFLGVEVLAVFLIVAIVKARKSLPVDDEDEPNTPTASDKEVAMTEPILEQADTRIEAAVMEASPDQTEIEPTAPITESEDSQNSISAVDAICNECNLSQRERDVFTLLARGYTSPRIQKELYIAAGTVNYHSRNIYAKLGVHSKQELIALVESRNL